MVLEANKSSNRCKPELSSEIYFMDPFRRFSIYLWLTLKSLPPVSWGRLLMPTTFILSWTILRATDLPENICFVWAAVIAQSTQLWIMLPVAFDREKTRLTASPWPLKLVLVLNLLTMLLQISLSDPLVTHRIITIFCVGYCVTMLTGILGDRDVLDKFARVATNSNVSLGFRRHYLKLGALTTFLVLVVNEALVALNLDLSVRVATLALLPIALHYFFDIAMRLTHPPIDN